MNAEVMSGATSAVGAVGRGIEASTAGAAKGLANGAETSFGLAKSQSLGAFPQTQTDRFIPSLNKDIFTNTSPATVFADFQDRPVSAFSLKDMKIVASNQQKPVENPAEPTVIFENISKSLSPAPLSQMAEGFGSAEALVQNNKELVMASNIKTILIEVGVKEKEAERVSQEALEQALGKKLKEKVKKKEEEEAVEEDEEEPKKDSAKKEENREPMFVRDEFADDARKKDGEKAVKDAFNEADDSQNEIKGIAIVSKMNQTPSEDEVSEIALKHGQKQDGSYSEILNEMKRSTFTSKEEAMAKLEELISQKPAVTKGKGEVVGEEDVRRVLTLKSFRNPVLDFLTKFVRSSK